MHQAHVRQLEFHEDWNGTDAVRLQRNSRHEDFNNSHMNSLHLMHRARRLYSVLPPSNSARLHPRSSYLSYKLHPPR